MPQMVIEHSENVLYFKLLQLQKKIMADYFILVFYIQCFVKKLILSISVNSLILCICFTDILICNVEIEMCM